MSNTLVACFSPTGVTLEVAEVIVPLVSGELFKIVPAVPYTAADLDWHNPESRTSVEMKDSTCRPAIADQVVDMAQFQNVFLGFPVWWYDAPRIILTFLESYDFAGKNMFPFATSGSSGLGDIPKNLQTACPVANWRPGICLPGKPDMAKVTAWVRNQ